MHRFKWIFVIGLVLIIACSKDFKSKVNLPQDRFIWAYFNHRETDREYDEPYRNITRSGDNLEAVIVREIAAAKSTINLAVQELNLPLVAQALADRYRFGVEVKVILDDRYSRSLSQLSQQQIEQLEQRDRQKYQSFFNLVDLNQDNNLDAREIAQQDALFILKQAGIPIIDDTADGSKGSGLMHHKFMVIDNKIVLTGSTNFTVSGIHGDLNDLATRGNANHLLRIENTELADLFTEEFNYMWGDNPRGGVNSKFGLQKPWRSPKTIIWQDTKLTVQFAPTSSTKNWELSTNGLIDKTLKNATKAIDLALFVFSEQQLANTLKQLRQQNIQIRGVFDSGFAYRYYSEVLDMLGVTLYFRCQPEANNSPWTTSLNTIGTPQIAKGDKLHHKFAVIDDRTVISGSPNWSQAANLNNDEALLVVSNSTLARHFIREFERLYDSALLGLPATVQNKAARQRQKCSQS
jgi:phosphatidylserine/phosphatidylglycerophosphate/cardiolipin synthase-like enzyme